MFLGETRRPHIVVLDWARIIDPCQMPLFERKTVLIYGLIGLLRFTITSGNENDDSRLLGYAREMRQRLQTEIEAQVRVTCPHSPRMRSYDSFLFRVCG